MKLRIEIEMDNAAFGDDQSSVRGEEVARILKLIAGSCELYGLTDIFSTKLRDINGNTVGRAEVIK